MRFCNGGFFLFLLCNYYHYAFNKAVRRYAIVGLELDNLLIVVLFYFVYTVSYVTLCYSYSRDYSIIVKCIG